MEDTLRALQKVRKLFGGLSLNPCFNGRYSQRVTKDEWCNLPLVLILVLMEDTLRDNDADMMTVKEFIVLILVLMEDTLRDGLDQSYNVRINGLNPCFNGRYSQRVTKDEWCNLPLVLILVLMEDTLRDKEIKDAANVAES